MELKELIDIQNSLKQKIVIKPFKKDFSLALAVDSSYSKKLDKIISVAIIYDKREKKVTERQYSIGNVTFPYIPGFLSFREIDNTLKAVKTIKTSYEIIIVDGQGMAHPRNFGFASHLGVILDKPTIGCAKSRLVGEFKDPENFKGAFSYLYQNSDKIGAVLRTKKDTKPLFISPGHMIDIDSSIEVILQLTDKFRLPEPIRSAHLFAEEVKKTWEK